MHLLSLSLAVLSLGLARAQSDCGVDLQIVLDTSGSVRDEFEMERKTAEELVMALNADSYTSGDVKVSLVEFYEPNKLAFGFQQGRSQQETLQMVQAIQHTGGATKIVPALRLGMSQLSGVRRGAQQVMVLISDGHGQDLWGEVMRMSQTLKDSGVEVYAVTRSPNYNEEELALYTNDPSRVFVGGNYRQFIGQISQAIRQCAPAPAPFIVQEPPVMPVEEKLPY